MNNIKMAQELVDNLMTSDETSSVICLHLMKAKAVLRALGETLFNEEDTIDPITVKLHYAEWRLLYAVVRDNIQEAIDMLEVCDE